MARRFCAKVRPLEERRRLYRLLRELSARLGGARTLGPCKAAMDWPARGVYFFFEPGEERTATGDGPRVVRVGTHALTDGSKSTLWSRLSAHRGSVKTGGGSHRASIFRLLVGIALCRRRRRAAPRSWGIGSSPGVAAARLQISRERVLAEEHPVEVEVSSVIRAMPFLWVAVDDPPGPKSDRGLIECNCIGLLSISRVLRPTPSPSIGSATSVIGRQCGTPVCGTLTVWRRSPRALHLTRLSAEFTR